MLFFHDINDDLYKIKFIVLTIFRLNSQLSLTPLDCAVILTRELQNRLQQRFFFPVAHGDATNKNDFDH
jgi:hypothetical protein